MLNDALNPIFEYAAKGQYFEKDRQWERSIRWYQRALACLPNLYGTEKKIRQFPLIGAKPKFFSPQHAGRIYFALGRCLMALERWQDSMLAFRAAHRLDSGNVSARQFLHANAQYIHDEGSEPAVADAAVTLRQHAPGIDLKKNLTLVMVTHCADRLKKYAALSPPSCKLVTATYGSMLKVFGEDICACPKILCYDRNPKGTARDSQYTKALGRFARQQGFVLSAYPGIGLFNILARIIPTITTPYIFFVEHDWMFRGDPIQLHVIIEMMNADSRLHSVRFNKRENHINGHDFIMTVAPSQNDYALMRTSSYSNNPSIFRTDKFNKEWLPICERALRLVSGKLGGSAFGVEEILFKRHVQDIRSNGFDQAHAVWGTYVFGRVGEKPRVVHLGE